MKLTGWYGYKQYPVRKGVYETLLIGEASGLIISSGFSFWTSKGWSDTRESIYSAQFLKRSKPVRFKKMWRGVQK